MISFAQKLKVDFDFLSTVDKVNRTQVNYFIDKVVKACQDSIQNKTIAILGLAFKPNTDDMREARSVLVIKKLQSLGAKIKAYDPVAMPNAKKILKKVKYGQNAYSVVKGADVLCLVTEWEEFQSLNFKKVKRLMEKPVIVDGRNFYDPRKLRKLGFTYLGMGRK